MAEFKLVISDPKTGLSIQKGVKDQAYQGFMGLKLGDSVKGELLDLRGYEFIITGGSDYCGFPMRRDVIGTNRRRILAYDGVGVVKQEKGMLQRKTVCGNTIHAKIVQINLKVTKPGTANIFADAGKKKESKQEEATDADKEKPKQQKQEKPKEEKKVEVKEEKKERPKEVKADEKPEQKKSDEKSSK